ncbi:MAG: hypothetical protein QOG71_1716 [Pyrinomonadaceae bacterium]|nr:hypothetical protein [Pyrinomonadaceae bacterium]
MPAPEPNDQNTDDLHFDVHASVVFQLGESLISDVVQALVELVKNAYDADAKSVRVIVDTKATPGKDSAYPNAKGYIAIDDTGVGMDYNTIKRGWLTISNSPKREMKREHKVTVLKRTPLGDKGLGRLGTQRLGSNLEIYTRPEGSDTEYYVAFSWKDFASATKLSDVPLRIEQYPAKRKKGTRLVISDLLDKSYWGENADVKLQADLSRMISPYRDVRKFIVTAKVNGKRLDLIQFADQIRKTAQIHYRIDFDGENFLVKGQTRLDFFKPEVPKELEEFKELVEKDEGKEFYKFLINQTRAKDYYLKKSKDAGWFVEFEYRKKFSDFDDLQEVLVSDEESEIANPGPFSGEIDSFDLGMESVERQNVFNSVSAYREHIKNISGIRVYRDGFGVRVDPDFLQLGKQWTSAKSYYGLKPGSTMGYISLSAKENAQLEEKTDREGFKITAYYLNFYEMITAFADFTQNVQGFIRRGYVKFRRQNQEKLAKVERDATPEEVAKHINQRLSRAASYKGDLEGLRGKLEVTANDAQEKLHDIETTLSKNSTQQQELKAATLTLKRSLLDAQKSVAKVELYLAEVVDSSAGVKVLESHIQTLKDQVVQFYDTMSLGLTAEALSHEIHNIAVQLAYRTEQITQHLESSKDSKLISYTEFVNTSVNGLRKQLRHLDPSLRYVREKREPVVLTNLFKEILDYFHSRFEKRDIEARLKITNANGFVLDINKGKLVQIIDNLFLNSEYWLREDIRLGRINHGVITIELARPFVRISDNGRGIESTVETSLFEPFVTTKRKGKGRGLGLFIVRQLLDSEGCAISLLPKRNANNRQYVFELNFTGALHGSEQTGSNGNQ